MPTTLMPEHLLDKAAQRFKALADPIRLKMLNQLALREELCVMDLVEATGHQQANVSKHLAVMMREGILRRRKQGLKVFYSIGDPNIYGLCLLVCGKLRDEGTAL